MAEKQGYVCEKQGYANSSSRGQEGAQDLATAQGARRSKWRRSRVIGIARQWREEG